MSLLEEPIIATGDIELAWQGIDHPEGLAIDQDGTVWCGGEEGQVFRGRLDGEPEQIATVPGRPLGFALDAAGNGYCCAYEEPGVFRIAPDGDVRLLSRGTRERPAVLPNHLAFLPSGVLLFSDSGQWGEANGCLYAIRPDGETSLAVDSTANFPNGLCVSPDGRTLVVAESTLPGVAAFDIEGDGTLGERRVLIEIPDTVPEGLAYDARGGLLISSWSPDAIFRLAPSGELSLLAHDPHRLVLHEPTNIAFVPETRRLVAANYGERFLSVLEHDCLGAPVLRPLFPSAA